MKDNKLQSMLNTKDEKDMIYFTIIIMIKFERELRMTTRDIQRFEK